MHCPFCRSTDTRVLDSRFWSRGSGLVGPSLWINGLLLWITTGYLWAIHPGPVN